MKKRFIVLVDFSDHSEWLLSFAYKWAKETGAELLLIHHSTAPIPGFGDSDIRNEMKRSNAEQALDRLRAYAYAIVGTDPAIKFHADTYNLAGAVLKLQEPGTTDYLFVGMNDKSAFENYVGGSTASQLVEETDSIIIALPTSMPAYNFDKWHVGVKTAYRLKDTAFSDLLSIKGNSINECKFFSVIKPGSSREKTEEYLESICTKYENHLPVSYEILESENPIPAIKQYMMEKRGVLVVQKGSRSLLDIFRKFFTTEIVHHAQVPVIILP